VAVVLKGGMAVVEVEGVRMAYDNEQALARSIRDTSVIILSSSRGS